MEDPCAGPASTGNELERILVVDDEPGVRHAVSRGLVRGGYDVSVAANGREALRTMTCDPTIAAVVTDFNMPVMNGAQLAAEVIDHHPGVPILFLSSQGAPEQLHTNPLVDSIRKPPSIAELRDRLRKLLTAATRYRRRSSPLKAPVARVAHTALRDGPKL